MGFNNSGVDAIRRRLGKAHGTILVGGNIGKNKATPNEQAVSDYEICFEALFDVVDYFVVNVSSPNTPNLRELQDKEPLQALLSRLVDLNNAKKQPKPVFLKIAPDLTDGQLDDVIGIVKKTGIHGLIATNTTISRDGLTTPSEVIQNIGDGGLSGKPLRERSTEMIRYIHEKSGGAIPVIGVGGIHSAKDALEKLEAGACLVQIYTGFIYEGPGLIREINREIERLSDGKN
jgi:dihydroorotate dehydrogenase